MKTALDTAHSKGRFVEGYTCFYEKRAGACRERVSNKATIFEGSAIACSTALTFICYTRPGSARHSLNDGWLGKHPQLRI